MSVARSDIAMAALSAGEQKGQRMRVCVYEDMEKLLLSKTVETTVETTVEMTAEKKA